jgi:hypothetical protein
MISSKKHMIQPYEYLTILKDISFFLILKIGYHHLFEICRVARTEVGKMCHFSSKNGCDLPPVKLYHLSCFGFGKNNSTHCALRFANPNAVLASLLSACLHFEGKAFGVRKAAAKWFPDFNLLTAADLVHVFRVP